MNFDNEAEKVDWLYGTNKIDKDNYESWMTKIMNKAHSDRNATLYKLSCDSLGAQNIDKDLYTIGEQDITDKIKEQESREAILEQVNADIKRDGDLARMKEKGEKFIKYIHNHGINIKDFKVDPEGKKKAILYAFGTHFSEETFEKMKPVSIGAMTNKLYNQYGNISKN